MSFGLYDPFQVVLNKEGNNVTSFSINSGKIFNFYNPLNYRNVLCGLKKPALPELPYSISSNNVILEDGKSITKIKFIEETSFKINSSTMQIVIYLFACFLPPEKWVPGSSYIPFIDKSWVVCKFFNGLGEDSEFTIVGETKNPSPENIKFEVFDINKFNLESSPLYSSNKDLFEEEINSNFNAVNLGPIAKLIKINNNWQITQFIKDNYAFTELFDSSFYEKCNIPEFDLNLREKIKEEEKESSVIYQKFLNKQKAFEFMMPPSQNHMRGYIKYTFNGISPGESKILEAQYKFPPDNDYIRLERLGDQSFEKGGGY
jgi:hypothetical protein